MKEQEAIDISVPNDWKEMTQKQLRYFFIMINTEESMEAAITRCFMKWGGIKVVGRNSRMDFLLRKGRRFFAISPVDLWQLMRPVYFLQDPPKSPVILIKYRRRRAIDPLFKGVPFEKYLSCLAVWNDMMRAGGPEERQIRQLIFLLYGFRPKIIPKELFGCVVYWMSSIQDYMSRTFPDLFAPASSDGQGSLGSASVSFQESMNAMIRALTKGDVLKEKEVLECDAWRALVELNAQAREARQINEKINRK